MASKLQGEPKVLSEAKITARFKASGCLCALDPATDIDIGKKVLTFDNGLVQYSKIEDVAKISAEEKRRKGCIAQHIARFCSAPDGVSMPGESVLVMRSEDIWWVSGEAEESMSKYINLGCSRLASAHAAHAAVAVFQLHTRQWQIARQISLSK